MSSATQNAERTFNVSATGQDPAPFRPAGGGVVSGDFAAPSLTLGTTNTAGVSGKVIASDSTVLAFDATTPAAEAFGAAGTVGVATTATRRDHVHPMPSFATPAIVLGTAAAAGAATTPIRSDGTIVAFDATVAATQTNPSTAATGSVALAARRDHLHGIATPATPSTQAFGDAASSGAGTGFATDTHKHGFPSSDTLWTLVGSNSTEQTTTSASAVDLVTIGGLNIAVTSWVRILIQARKSASTAQPATGLKLNSTTVVEAQAGAFILFTSTNEAQSGMSEILIPPRAATFLTGFAGYMGISGATAGSHAALSAIQQTADFPNAAITSVIIRAISDGSATIGVKNVSVYVGA